MKVNFFEKMLYGFLRSDAEIIKTKRRLKIKHWCLEHNIKGYSINEDFSINVNGNVYLDDKGLGVLPFKFNFVSGNFLCVRNNLTSLENCPTIVGGEFNCSDNNLTSLEFCPQKIKGDFSCIKNNLLSLVGCPEKIGCSFDCGSNKLSSLEGGPKEVGGYYSCSQNQLNSLKGAPKNVLSFMANENLLKNLEFCPENIEHEFDFSTNQITTLKYFPKYVGGRIRTIGNKELSHLWHLDSFENMYEEHVIEKEKSEIEKNIDIAPSVSISKPKSLMKI